MMWMSEGGREKKGKAAPATDRKKRGRRRYLPTGIKEKNEILYFEKGFYEG